MGRMEEAKARKDKFIEIYANMEIPNGSEAARKAGFSPTRATVTASELLKDPYVQEQLRKVQKVKAECLTDGSESIQDTFDKNFPKALALLARSALVDTDSAKQFMEFKLKFDKQKEEVEGEYANLSTEEIIGRVNINIQRAKELIDRVMEEKREDTLQEGSDLSMQSSPGIGRSEEECVGESPLRDSGEGSEPTGGRQSTPIDTTGTPKVNISDPGLDNPEVTDRPNT